MECAGGGCRECLTESGGTRTCPVIVGGPPVVAESSARIERPKLLEFNPPDMLRKIVDDPEESATISTIRGAASMLSAVMKSLPMGKLDRASLHAVDSSLSDALGRELSAMYIEMNPAKAVHNLMVSGTLMNMRRAMRATLSLFDVDLDSLRRDEAYLSEAADILTKSARAFCEADAVSAQDVSESFRLYVPSLGSKQRMASQSTVLWSMTVAINGFFTARLLL